MITLKEYFEKGKNAFNTHTHLLKEGGQAAENALPTLIQNTGNERLTYIRATPSEDVLNEINLIYKILTDNNLIEDESPSFILGSSRLFAIATGIKQPEPNKYEPLETINKALKTKKTFGDIDLDVSYKPGVTPSIIKTFINNQNNQKYAAQSFGDEVSVATIVDGTNNVIQIDIVNIRDKKEYFKYSQFSSMADMAENIKGVIRDVLVRAFVKTHPIPQEQHEAIINLIKTTDQYKKFVAKNASKNPDIDVRYSLGKDGLLLRIVWLKDGTSSSFTDKGIKYEKLYQLIDDESINAIGYNKADIIAEILGLSDPEQMKHVTSMMDIIKNLNTERKQRIWNSMYKNLQGKLPNPERGRMIGQISKEEAQHALNYMSKYFGPDVNTSMNENYQIDEALKMTSIPHIDQMTIPQIISLFDSDEWEITEKADGSNVSFGLDENGIYVKSKTSAPVYDPQEYINLSVRYNNDIHLGFAELLSFLQNNSDTFKQFYNKHNEIINNKGFQIFGELFSKSHMNVIAYDPQKIGRGAVYIFMVKTDTKSNKGNDITDTAIGKQIINDFVSTFQNTDNWHFYTKRPVDMSIGKSTNKNRIVEIIKNNKDILSSRLKIHREQKNSIIAELTRLLSLLKGETLNQMKGIRSVLGADEMEGVILRNLNNGVLAKIVDLEDFGARRVEQWAGPDKIKKLKQELYSKIQKEILDNADIFVLPEKQIQKLTDALSSREQGYQNVEEIINVLYQDASNERPRLKDNYKNILNNLFIILLDHIDKVKDTIQDVEYNNTAAYESTQNAIQAEVKEINSIIENLKKLKTTQEFYTEVIKFLIGFKGLKNLTQIFLKNG